MIEDFSLLENLDKYLESVGAQVFAVHFLNSFAHAGDVRVLHKGILRDTVNPLNIDILKKDKSKNRGVRREHRPTTITNAR